MPEAIHRVSSMELMVAFVVPVIVMLVPAVIRLVMFWKVGATEPPEVKIWLAEPAEVKAYAEPLLHGRLPAEPIEEVAVPPFAIGRMPVTSELARFTAAEESRPEELACRTPAPRAAKVMVPLAYKLEVEALASWVLPVTSRVEEALRAPEA